VVYTRDEMCAGFAVLSCHHLKKDPLKQQNTRRSAHVAYIMYILTYAQQNGAFHVINLNFICTSEKSNNFTRKLVVYMLDRHICVRYRDSDSRMKDGYYEYCQLSSVNCLVSFV